MAKVHQEPRQRGGQWADAATDQVDLQEFHAACIDDNGKDGRSPPGETGLRHVQAKR